MTRMEGGEQGGFFISLQFALKDGTLKPLWFVLFQKKGQEKFEASANSKR